ncbi:MAG: restriction endonuclease, partial [Anaerolineae bacterium]|nr:restriction endonuclease [Anaerolineae bacterium]
SSNPGDVVLDPFCGCGTAVVAAQKLGRRWVGIDITHLAIALIRNRLNDSFGDDAEYEVLGEPEDLAGARALAAQNAHQFEWWALSLVRAQPARPAEPAGRGRVRRGKKGADQGFDGQITFIDDGAGRAKRVLVQVKSGKVGVSVVRDLRGAIEREGAAIGVLITLQPATPAMEQEAAAAGFYESEGWGQKYPRIQILSIEDLVAGAARVRMPPVKRAFKRAEPINRSEQQNLL